MFRAVPYTCTGLLYIQLQGQVFAESWLWAATTYTQMACIVPRTFTSPLQVHSAADPKS